MMADDKLTPRLPIFRDPAQCIWSRCWLHNGGPSWWVSQKSAVNLASAPTLYVQHQPLAGILHEIEHMLEAFDATIVRVGHLGTVKG